MSLMGDQRKAAAQAEQERVSRRDEMMRREGRYRATGLPPKLMAKIKRSLKLMHLMDAPVVRYKTHLYAPGGEVTVEVIG
jgi:hypothetical protein